MLPLFSFQLRELRCANSIRMVSLLMVITVLCIGSGRMVASEDTPTCSTEEVSTCQKNIEEFANQVRNASDDEKPCWRFEDVSKCFDELMPTCLSSDKRKEMKIIVEEIEEKCFELDTESFCYTKERTCYSEMTRYWPYDFSLNTEDLDLRCRENTFILSCLKSLQGKCGSFKASYGEYLRQRIHHTMKVEKTICKDGHPEREGYLKYSPCLRNIQPDIRNNCVANTFEYVSAWREVDKNELRMEEIAKRETILDCCTDQLLRLCGTRKLQIYCGKDALDFLMKINITYPDERKDRCDPSWSVESETCQSIFPKAFVESIVPLSGNKEKPLFLVVLFATTLSTLSAAFRRSDL